MSDPASFDPAPPTWGASAPPGFGRRLLRTLGELAQTLIIAGLLFLLVNMVTARIRVEGNSMEPSLHDGEFVVVNRLAYRLDNPARGDIVVFHFPLDTGRRFIKRIVGEPGDIVQIQGGQVYVNGNLLDEPYIAAAPRYSGEWQVGPDQAFVLGDNRNNSSDSQNWGMLPLSEIIGKAVLIYWPLTDIGLIPHYELATAASN
ncbi:MAG TPA: signal peptidase I [Anaerolineales bacterium]|jgi:signal peptidase I